MWTEFSHALDSCREFNILKEFVIVEVRCRREEAGHLHLSLAVVLQHVNFALREQDSRSLPYSRNFAAYHYPARSLDDVDDLFTVRMRMGRAHGLPWLE